MAVVNDGLTLGLVIQKSHIRAKNDFAGALLVSAAGMDGVTLNTGLSTLASADASLTTRIGAEETARSQAVSTEVSLRASSDVSIGVAYNNADTSVVTRMEATGSTNASSRL